MVGIYKSAHCAVSIVAFMGRTVVIVASQKMIPISIWPGMPSILTLLKIPGDSILGDQHIKKEKFCFTLMVYQSQELTTSRMKPQKVLIFICKPGL